MIGIKVLLAAPTSDKKRYCQTEWLKHIKQFTGADYDILIVDNSETLDNVREIHAFGGIIAKHYKPDERGLIYTINGCMNYIRDYFLKNNYTHLFILESDQFPPKDTIQRLLSHNLPVVCHSFFHYTDVNLMVFDIQKILGVQVSCRMPLMQSYLFCDGTVKKATGTGLGCVLICRDVVERVPFRIPPKESKLYKNGAFPDHYFHIDLIEKNISCFCDTSRISRHYNNSERWQKIFDSTKIE